MTCGLSGPDETPERASVQLNVTVTFPLFHPEEFGDGDADPDRTGRVSSILTITVTELVSPAPSVPVHVKVVPLVWDDRVVIEQPEEESIPDSGSLTTQLTVTVELFHPLELEPGV